MEDDSIEVYGCWGFELMCLIFNRNYSTWVRQLVLKAKGFSTSSLACFQQPNTSVEAFSQERDLERGNILTYRHSSNAEFYIAKAANLFLDLFIPLPFSPSSRK